MSKQSVLEDFCWNINFGHADSDPSSTPYLTGSLGIIYLLSVSYYVIALLVSLCHRRRELAVYVEAKAKFLGLILDTAARGAGLRPDRPPRVP